MQGVSHLFGSQGNIAPIQHPKLEPVHGRAQRMELFLDGLQVDAANASLARST